MFNSSQEFTLVKFLLTRDNYNKYYKFIKALNLEQETKLLTSSIASYFEEYKEAEDISVDNLLLFINTKNPVAKQGEIFNAIIEKLSKTSINDTLIKENFNSILEYYYGTELLYLITDSIEDKKSGFLDRASNILDDFQEVKLKVLNKEDKFVSNNILELVKKKASQPGLSWRVNCLNLHVGDLKGKSLGHVFARVDTGKTSFVLSEAANWIKQLKEDEVIVHFNNEEDGEKLMQRFCQSLLEVTKEQLEQYPVECDKEFKKRGGDKFKLYDSAVIFIEDIESVLKEYNVRVVLVDQADKLHFTGDKSVGDVARLQAIYAKLRELAKKYGCDILTVGQASQSAENKKWLSTTDLDGSKTLKPGEFDYIIGIGRIQDADSVDNGFRYIHLCKNKMGTGQHAQQSVYIDTVKAVYYDVATRGSTHATTPEVGSQAGVSTRGAPMYFGDI